MSIELEHLRAQIEELLPAGLVTELDRSGVKLVLSSSSSYPACVAGPHPVVIDPELEVEEDEMTAYSKESTGVDNVLFITPKGHARHGPRIKVAVDPPQNLNPHTGNVASVDFEGTVRAGDVPSWLLTQVRDFIAMNKPLLTDIWEYRCHGAEINRRMTKI